MKCPVVYDAKTKVWTQPPTNKLPIVLLGKKILEQLNKNDPNKIIEINYDNGEKLTSNGLKIQTITAAQNLINLGIKKGDVVLFFSNLNSLTTSIVFACYIIGAAICPMELMLDDDDAEFVVTQLDPTIILYDEIYENRVQTLMKKIKLTNLKYVFSFEPKANRQSVPEMLCNEIKSIDDFKAPELGEPEKVVAGLILTSGSTGRPKIISLSHAQIYAGVLTWWPIDFNGLVYVASPFRWISQGSIMLQTIFSNAARVFSGQAPTPEICSDLIKKHGVTNFFAVTGLITNILKNVEHKNGDDLKTVRYILTGGERISSVVDELIKKLIPECCLIKGYGMTELAGCIASNLNVTNKDTGGSYIAPGLSIKIIDDNKNPLGPNKKGQICIKSLSPYCKYFKNDKANDECFFDNGWFNTGDFGEFDDEHLLYVYNRYKDLIRCGQNVVIPSIVEKYLDSHSAIDISCVVGIPDRNKGEIPIAFTKFKSTFSNTEISEDELREDIKKYLLLKLPSDQIPPEQLYFVQSYPYTSCGKINKIELRSMAMRDLPK